MKVGDLVKAKATIKEMRGLIGQVIEVDNRPIRVDFHGELDSSGWRPMSYFDVAFEKEETPDEAR